MVVGALIFVLGIDLVKEALWDTRHRVSTSEYVTIASIMICMTVWDFVTGVLFGIVVSCKRTSCPQRNMPLTSSLQAFSSSCKARSASDEGSSPNDIRRSDTEPAMKISKHRIQGMIARRV